jgi:hypothetical protein
LRRLLRPTRLVTGWFWLVAPRPRGVGVRGVGGGVGCPPRGDAAARCHLNHNALNQEHKGQMLSFLRSLVRAKAACGATSSRVGAPNVLASLRSRPTIVPSWHNGEAATHNFCCRGREGGRICRKGSLRGQDRAMPYRGSSRRSWDGRCRCDGKLHRRGALRPCVGNTSQISWFYARVCRFGGARSVAVVPAAHRRLR